MIDPAGKVIDEVSSYIGMRKVHIEGNKIYLNNKPYYRLSRYWIRVSIPMASGRLLPMKH